MVQNIFSNPAHNLNCNYRFTCAAAQCPEYANALNQPSCHVDKFRRYQPGNDRYHRNWEQVNRIAWREVFGFQETWMYILYIIIISVFMFMVMLLIKVLLLMNIIYLLP